MKKYFIAIGFLAIFICIMFVGIKLTTYADEEQQEETPEVVEVIETEEAEEIVEEESSVSKELYSIAEKWLIAVLSVLGGSVGTAVLTLFFKKVLSTILENIKKSTSLTDEQKTQLAKKVEDTSAKVDALANKLEGISEEQKNVLTKFIAEMNTTDMLRKLIALLVTENPDMCSSGYAQKILDVIKDKEE